MIMGAFKPIDFSLALLLFLVPAIAPIAIKGVVVVLPLMALVTLGLYRGQEKAWPFSSSLSALWLGVIVFLVYAGVSFLWAGDAGAVFVRVAKLILPLGGVFVLLQIINKHEINVQRKLFYSSAICAGFIVGVIGMMWRHIDAVSFPIYLNNINVFSENILTKSVSNMNKPFTLLVFCLVPFVWSVRNLLQKHARTFAWPMAMIVGLILLYLAMPTKDVLAGQLLIGISLSGILMAVILPWNRLFVFASGAAIIGGTIVLMISVLVLGDYFLNKYYTSLPSSVVSRVEIWDLTLDRVKERPLLGWGLDSYDYIEDRGEVSTLYTKPMTIIHMHPHNGFVQILYELGLIGLVMVLCLIFAVMRQLYRSGSRGIVVRLLAVYSVIAFAAMLPSFGMWQGWLIASLCLSVFMGSIMLSSSRHEEGRL